MPNSIVLRNKRTLRKKQLTEYCQPVKCLLEFIKYKQTHFPVSTSEGEHLIPLNTIHSISQKTNGSLIKCLNNHQIHSAHSIDYWQRSLAGFDRFIEENKSYETKIIRLN